jgi:hypothetical protein
MLAFHRWKLNSKLLGKLLMPPLLPRSKSTKLALAKAKKAEKALTDANKEHLQRGQAVAERLNKMSVAAGGTYYSFLSFC